jgi:hypothetical protein
MAKVLDSPTAEQVFVLGAVYGEATPESYLKLSVIDAEAQSSFRTRQSIREWAGFR